MDAIAGGTLAAEIVGVFSDRSKAAALQRARDAGIAARSLAPKNFASRAAFDAALFAAVDGVRPDLIVCAGYMRLISARAKAHPSKLQSILHIAYALLCLKKNTNTISANLITQNK